MKGKIPKKYTSRLNKKDRQKQIHNIYKSRKSYKKKKYINRPKLSKFDTIL